MDVLEHLLKSALPASVGSLEEWLATCADAPYPLPIDRAFWTGFEADRLGYAFIGGYEAALDRLLGERSPKRRCLAATEANGGHPKAIETTLADGVLTGTKTFATMAVHADELLVVAKAGTLPDGRNQLVLLNVPRTAKGITITRRSPTPFAPEIPHARVEFAGVTELTVMTGDAYDNYLKPFRTIEDVHVVGATLGYLIAVARRSGFAKSYIEELTALVLATRASAETDPRMATNHLALAGIFSALRRLVTAHEAEWQKASSEERERWQRDVGLLMVAEMVRTKRTEAAWGNLER